MDLVEDFAIIRYNGEEALEVDDQVVKEFPLSIIVNDQRLVTLACSPVDFEELAAGYLFSEGLITAKAEIVAITQEDDWIRVELTEKRIELSPMTHKVITSGCGRSTIFSDLSGSGLKKVRSEARFSHEMIYQAAHTLHRSSVLFAETGGVHNALLTDVQGDLAIFREDVGRHNAVDKLIGYLVLQEQMPDDKALLTTGRISTEILLKTARRQIPLLISRSAPTDLAIRLAYRLGITLIGFARGKRMNIYTHPERII